MKDMDLDNDRLVGRRAGLVTAQVDDQMILMDVDTAAVFQLNRTGARIWDLIETPRTIGDLVAALEQSFAGGGDALRADVCGFVVAMRDTGLLEISA